MIHRRLNILMLGFTGARKSYLASLCSALVRTR